MFSALTAAALAFDPTDELAPGGPTVVATVLNGPIRTAVLATSVTNTDTGTFQDVSVAIGGPLPPWLNVVDGVVDLGAVGPLATVGGGADRFVVRFPDAMRSQAASALAAAGLVVSGTEVRVAAAGVVVLDDATAALYSRTEPGTADPNGVADPALSYEVFLSSTPQLAGLVPGDVLLRDAVDGGSLAGVDGGLLSLPAQVVDAVDVNGEAWVSVVPVPASVALYESGTFDAPASEWIPYGPEYPSEASECPPQDYSTWPYETVCTDLDGLAGWTGPGETETRMHAPFVPMDGIDLGGVTLGGGLKIRDVDAGFGIRVRGGSIEEVEADVSLGWDAAVHVSADQDVSIVDQELQLFTFAIPVPSGAAIAGIPIDVTLEVTALAGADGSIAGGSAFGARQSGTFGALVSCDFESNPAGDCSLTSTSTVTAADASEPTLSGSVDADLTAWAGTDIALHVGDAVATVGPEVRGRAIVDLHASTLEDPFWTLDATTELSGAFAFDALGLTVAEVPLGAVSDTTALGSAGGPIGAAVGGRSAGAGVRWGRALDGTGGPIDVADRLAVLADGSLVVSFHDPNSATLAKLTPQGDLVWAWDWSRSLRDLEVHELADATLLVVGDDGNDVWVMQLAADGTELWARAVDLAGTVSELDSTVSSDGVGLHVVFSGAYFVATERRGLLGRLLVDPPSATPVTIEWLQAYREAGGQNVFFSALLDEAGTYTVAGRTQADLTDLEVNHGTPSADNGLVAQLDATGLPVWIRTLGSATFDRFDAIAPLPGGGYVVAGLSTGTVYDLADYDFMTVVTLAADGTMTGQRGWAEDVEWHEEFAATPVPAYDEPGASAYDAARVLVPLADGFALAGKTGLGAGSAGWVIRFDDALDVKWLTRLDGVAEDQLQDLAVGTDGLVGFGTTDSDRVNDDAWVVSVPWDGGSPFPAASVVGSYPKPDMDPMPGTWVDAFTNWWSTDTATWTVSDEAPVSSVSSPLHTQTAAVLGIADLDGL